MVVWREINARAFAWHLHPTLSLITQSRAQNWTANEEEVGFLNRVRGEVEGLCPSKFVEMALEKGCACRISIQLSSILKNGFSVT